MSGPAARACSDARLLRGDGRGRACAGQRGRRLDVWLGGRAPGSARTGRRRRDGEAPKTEKASQPRAGSGPGCRRRVRVWRAALGGRRWAGGVGPRRGRGGWREGEREGSGGLSTFFWGGGRRLHRRSASGPPRLSHAPFCAFSPIGLLASFITVSPNAPTLRNRRWCAPSLPRAAAATASKQSGAGAPGQRPRSVAHESLSV